MAKKWKKKRNVPLSLQKEPSSIPRRFRGKLAIILLAGLAIATWILFSLIQPKKRIRRDPGLNVLLITMDTTRFDRLGCYGYDAAQTPNLDDMANNGVRFASAYTPVPLTFPAHCSLLTGTTPLYHRSRNNGTYFLSPAIKTLAKTLQGKGLATAAFVSSFSVDSRFGLDQGFDVYDDNFSAEQTFKALNSERKADVVTTAFMRWFDKLGEKPFFAWVHYFDPHFPYDSLPPFKERFAENPYDGEIAAMDLYIGRILDKLRENGLLRRTLIVAVGDHGEAFGENGESGHGLFLYDSTMRVPMIFHAPGHLPQGRVVYSRISLIDVMPTILDLMQTPIDSSVQGSSLLPLISGKSSMDREIYMETYFPRENYGWSELTGLVSSGWKYIRAPKEEMYDLANDPSESKNLAAPEERRCRLMRVRLLEWIKTSVSHTVANTRRISSEEEQRLRTLGYISPYAGQADTGKPLSDPKDKIEEFTLIHQAEMDEMQGNFSAAERKYVQMLKLAPKVPIYYVNYALILSEMKRFDEAISLLKNASEKIPDSEILLERLGLIYMATGKWPEALASLDQTLRQNQRNFNALLSSGWILDQIGKTDEALSFYERAMTIEPENKFLRLNRALLLARIHKIAQAIEAYSSIIQDYPNDYEPYQYLGIAYGVAGNIAKSIENLEKAIQLHPTPLAYRNLAEALKAAQRYSEAIKYLRLYLENPVDEDEATIGSIRNELQSLEKKVQ